MRYSKFETEKEFKKFLRESKITMAQYFEKYEPRVDLLTQQKIKFKDRKTYFDIDFVDKRHMSKWLGDQHKKDQDDYILKKLSHRAKDKGWNFAPCQAECRSLKDVPSLNVVDYCHNDKIWKKLNLPRKYQYNNIKYQFNDLNGAILGVDSREQKPLSFDDFKTKPHKFDFGDYCFINEPYFCNTFIERKSIQDLWGTMSKGFDRFNREIERAKNQNGYIIVVVDYSFQKACPPLDESGEDNSYNANRKYSKASSSFIFHRIREIMQTHDNVQFVFSGGRAGSIDLIQKIGLMGENAKNYDLQYLIDMKKI